MKCSAVDEDQSVVVNWGYEKRSHFENPSKDDDTYVVVVV